MLLLSRRHSFDEQRAPHHKGLLRLKLFGPELKNNTVRNAWRQCGEEWQQQSEINSMFGAAVDSLQGGATNALPVSLVAPRVFRKHSPTSARQSSNSVVGGLVQMGIEGQESVNGSGRCCCITGIDDSSGYRCCICMGSAARALQSHHG